MNILVINGSPRGEYSDTHRVLTSFIEGFKSIDNTSVIDSICLTEKNIQYCRGCLECMYNGGKCLITDDMSEIILKISRADIMFINTPLFHYSFPAILKNFFDRTLPFASVVQTNYNDTDCFHKSNYVANCKQVFFCGYGHAIINKDKIIENLKSFRVSLMHNQSLVLIDRSVIYSFEGFEEVVKKQLETSFLMGRDYAITGEIPTLQSIDLLYSNEEYLKLLEIRSRAYPNFMENREYTEYVAYINNKYYPNTEEYK